MSLQKPSESQRISQKELPGSWDVNGYQKNFLKVGMFLFGMSVEFVTGFLAQPSPPGQIFFVKNSLIDFLVLVHT